MTNTAELIRKLEGWRSDARLYRLRPEFDGHEYVIVSQVNANAPFSGWETYVFPAQADGEPRKDEENG